MGVCVRGVANFISQDLHFMMKLQMSNVRTIRTTLKFVITSRNTYRLLFKTVSFV